MKSCEVKTVVDAPAATVWALVIDITTTTRFSDELQEVRWIDRRRVIGHNRHPAIGVWETTCTVVDREPERTFGWVVGDPAHPPPHGASASSRATPISCCASGCGWGLPAPV
ncbi:MAG: SRPBCC family protein [Sciscionella sp.]